MTVSDLRTQTIRANAFTTWFGSPKEFIDLNAVEQNTVNQQMNRYIADNPSQFETAVVEQANRWLRVATNPPLADTSFGASVSEFGAAFADEVKKKTELGGGILRNVVYIAAGVGAVWFFFFRKK